MQNINIVDFENVLDQVISSEQSNTNEDFITADDSFGSWFEAD